MRTTLDIDIAVLEAARAIAASSQKSIGAVVSELALKGINARKMSPSGGKYPVFMVPEDAQPLDPSVVRDLIDEDGLSD